MRVPLLVLLVRLDDELSIRRMSLRVSPSAASFCFSDTPPGSDPLLDARGASKRSYLAPVLYPRLSFSAKRWDRSQAKRCIGGGSRCADTPSCCCPARRRGGAVTTVRPTLEPPR